jgi:hypothetical protein
MRRMNSQSSPQNLLSQIAQIPSMERGKLSFVRETSTGPAYKLQAWENGKNLSRYIPPEEVPVVREAVEGYQKFQALTEQYADLKIQETRAALQAGSKKKTRPPRLSSWPRTRKSKRS